MWRLKDKHSNGYTHCGKWVISENSSVDSKTTSVKWQAGVQQHRNLIKHTLPKIAFPCKIANHLLCTTKWQWKISSYTELKSDYIVYKNHVWFCMLIWFSSTACYAYGGLGFGHHRHERLNQHQRDNICMHIIFLACTTWYYISKSSCP